MRGPYPGFWVPNDYVVVVANARGYYDSEGEAGIYSEKDPEDYADLIEWAGVQTWSNGSGGLNGVSYLGISQWLYASVTKLRHLKAIIPWEGATDLFRDVLRHGGIPESRFVSAYYSGSLALGAGSDMGTQGAGMMERASNSSAINLLSTFRRPTHIKGKLMSVHFMTSTAKALLKEVYKQIQQTVNLGQITIWDKSADGICYAHKARDWHAKAWLKPVLLQTPGIQN